MKAIWKNIILVSMLTQVSVLSYASEFLACKPGQILVCIPAASCRAGSIGCRETPRPAQTCFCADSPRVLVEENFQNELKEEN